LEFERTVARVLSAGADLVGDREHDVDALLTSDIQVVRDLLCLKEVVACLDLYQRLPNG
jgi:hypothetical protein